MNETRRSFVSPTPPPHATAFYDAHQLATVRVICSGCQREFCAPAPSLRQPYVCVECLGSGAEADA